MTTRMFNGLLEVKDLDPYFLVRYKSEVVAWLSNWNKLSDDGGHTAIKSFVLREGFLSDPSPNPEVGARLIQVKLKGRQGNSGIVEVEPATERDKEIIAKHCIKMQALKVPAEMKLKEPDRPWIPFLPTIN